MNKKDIIVMCWIVLCMGVLSFAVFIHYQKQFMEFEGMKVPTYVYQNSQEVFGEDPGFMICSMKDNKCMPFIKT